MTIEILDPTHENSSTGFRAAPRLATLRGARLAIISNGKKGTVPFFDALERELYDAHGAAAVARLQKSNYSAPADTELFNDAARWHALVAGVGD